MWRIIVVPLLIGMVVAGVFSFSGGASAQTEGATGIAISPLTFEITANPGDVITNTIRLYNPNSQPVTAIVMPEDFSPSGEAGQAVIETAESTGYSIATWTSVANQEIAIGPREQGLVNFTIAVPLNAEPGGHYGALTAEVRGGAVTGASGAAISQKVAALLLVSVAGEVKEQLSLIDFSGPSGVVTDASLITLTSRFENKGSVHVKPAGFVTITDTFGRDLAQVALDQRNVLPGSKRAIETEWKPDGFVFGRVTANLTAIYGSTNTPVSGTVQFWVFPMNVFGPAFVTFAVLLVAGFVLRRRLGPAFSVLVRGQKPNA